MTTISYEPEFRRPCGCFATRSGRVTRRCKPHGPNHPENVAKRATNEEKERRPAVYPVRWDEVISMVLIDITEVDFDLEVVPRPCGCVHGIGSSRRDPTSVRIAPLEICGPCQAFAAAMAPQTAAFSAASNKIILVRRPIGCDDCKFVNYWQPPTPAVYSQEGDEPAHPACYSRAYSFPCPEHKPDDVWYFGIPTQSLK